MSWWKQYYRTHKYLGNQKDLSPTERKKLNNKVQKVKAKERNYKRSREALRSMNQLQQMIA